MKKKFGSHSNIWDFIHSLQNEEVHQAIRYTKLEKDLLQEKGSKTKEILKESRILELKFMYASSKIDIMDYLTRISNNMPDFE